MSKAPIKRTKKKFYEAYSKYFKDFAREYVKQKNKCEFQDSSCKGILTLAHLDQNTKNNDLLNLKVLCQSHHLRLDQPYHVFSMSTAKKTDNSYTAEKVRLRIDSLKLINKQEINILEAFAGDGVIWNEVQKYTDQKLNILKIDMKDNKKGVYLKGSNEKFLPLFNFENYDIIDLDAYGVPFNQLEVVFKKNFKGIVHCTFIQSGMGSLPYGMLFKLGYTKEMLKKVKTIFNKNGLQKMQNYLALNAVNETFGYYFDRKNYFYFNLLS
jgi:hypothetical protein